MKKSTEQLYKERILKVLVFIQRNLDSELSLDEFARVAHFSPYHFHRVFRGIVGESLQEHIRRLRLERAAMRLKHTDWTVLEIALEACDETHEPFTRAFRTVYDCSPSRFRLDKGLALKANAVGVQTLAGGEYAVVTHTSPYDTLGQTYAKLFGQWLPHSGRELRSEPSLEFYLNDPESTDPEDLLTGICAPLEPLT